VFYGCLIVTARVRPTDTSNRLKSILYSFVMHLTTMSYLKPYRTAMNGER